MFKTLQNFHVKSFQFLLSQYENVFIGTEPSKVTGLSLVLHGTISKAVIERDNAVSTSTGRIRKPNSGAFITMIPPDT